ncbi:hypothetical protein [Sphingomonas sp. TDK1]|uniref:hypothetical protein n=1 Tax=Sphingomonas sp. TDK1 TaxID=453247 RepID=UPI0007D94867|nr:hypothetical protein [Sphingomonas sp. TDK1]OAN58866.1 hypothetical protein A7X12_04280 [Sphingomonas sp. TDK1]
MNLPRVPLAALLLGGVSALAVVALPASMVHGLLSGAEWNAFLPEQVGAASRPLLALVTGAMGIGAGMAGAQLFGRREHEVASFGPGPMPAIRRIDAHPDARPRQPLRATHELDLPAWAADKDADAVSAAPVLPSERDLPADLDQPLAAFDPQAIPTVPLPPPVPPRRERAATPALRPQANRDPAERLVRPETDATVHALLERLERGVVRRNQAAQARARARTDRGLDDALAALRSLARQA